MSGLWHGANWTFVIWGALNGLFYFVRPPLTSARPLARTINAIVAFHLVCLGWIFFRAARGADAIAVLRRIASPSLLAAPSLASFRPALILLPASVLIVEALQAGGSTTLELGDVPRPLRLAFYGFVAGVIFFAGAFNRTPFIYFQF
jgi:hypothetical protein